MEGLEKGLGWPLHGDYVRMGNEQWSGWASMSKVEGREMNKYGKCREWMMDGRYGDVYERYEWW